MAEETENQDTEITPDPAEDAPTSEAQSAPESEGAAEAPSASASEAEAPPEAEAADAAPAADAPSAPAREPLEVIPPKERRQRQRAAKAAAVPTRSETSPEERQAEREVERRRKAQVRTLGRKRTREKARSRRSEAGTPEPLAPRREQHPGRQKTRQGIVVSDRASKTIVVRIDVTRRHRSYGKVIRTSTTLHAHDEREDAHTGDTVIVRESRPLSRTKRWRLVEVVEKAK